MPPRLRTLTDALNYGIDNLYDGERASGVLAVSTTRWPMMDDTAAGQSHFPPSPSFHHSRCFTTQSRTQLSSRYMYSRESCKFIAFFKRCYRYWFVSKTEDVDIFHNTCRGLFHQIRPSGHCLRAILPHVTSYLMLTNARRRAHFLHFCCPV